MCRNNLVYAVNTVRKSKLFINVARFSPLAPLSGGVQHTKAKSGREPGGTCEVGTWEPSDPLFWVIVLNFIKNAWLAFAGCSKKVLLLCDLKVNTTSAQNKIHLIFLN